MKKLFRSLIWLYAAAFVVATGGIAAAQCDCDKEFENCALPITSLSGQGYSVSGVTGGMTVEDPLSFMPPSASVDPREVLLDAGALYDNVAILVVDAFGGSYRIPQSVFSASSDADLEAYYASGTLTHGALVFNHINALLEGALTSSGFSPNRSGSDVVWTDGSKRVAVVMVDALDYNAPKPTLDVARMLSERMFKLLDDGYDTFVLNMSFAILPCAIAEGLATSGITFDQYVSSVQAAGNYYYEQIMTPVETLMHPDPLHYLLSQCAGSQAAFGAKSQFSQQTFAPDIRLPEDLRPVEMRFESPCDGNTRLRVAYAGSSGNSRLPFPFYPAAWREVVSVSASQDGALATYSNYNADSVLQGGWFLLVNGGQLQGRVTSSSVHYRGTSFSGPVQAVCMSLGVPC